MAGCFGNHPVDRWMEQQLNEYLDSHDDEWFKCENCGFENNAEEWDYDDEKGELICPECGNRITK